MGRGKARSEARAPPHASKRRRASRARAGRPLRRRSSRRLLPTTSCMEGVSNGRSVLHMNIVEPPPPTMPNSAAALHAEPSPAAPAGPWLPPETPRQPPPPRSRPRARPGRSSGARRCRAGGRKKSRRRPAQSLQLGVCDGGNSGEDPHEVVFVSSPANQSTERRAGTQICANPNPKAHEWARPRPDMEAYHGHLHTGRLHITGAQHGRCTAAKITMLHCPAPPMATSQRPPSPGATGHERFLALFPCILIFGRLRPRGPKNGGHRILRPAVPIRHHVASIIGRHPQRLLRPPPHGTPPSGDIGGWAVPRSRARQMALPTVAEFGHISIASGPILAETRAKFVRVHAQLGPFQANCG